jgi:3',5'-cyclic AMP phosphodiesterase CpdA
MRNRRVFLAALSGGLLAAAAIATASAPTTGAAPVADTAASAAAVTTTTFKPVADTFVAEYNAGGNFGARTTFAVDAAAIQRAFVKFSVAGLTEPVASAKLRLHVADVTGSASDVGGRWSLMSNTAWSESLVTFRNQPAIDGALLGTVGRVVRNTWVEIDVTGQITGNGTYSIGGTSTSSDGAEYDSREAGATAPQLVITTGSAPPSDPVIVGAGDIANETSGKFQTAALIEALPDATVFTTGDNVQRDGTAAEFTNWYDPSWGAFKSRTNPVPGNHDYKTASAAPYYNYFGARAGPSGLGYYSYNIGDWHLVALNSEISMVSGSPQEVWLRNDLAADTKQCTLAYWHKPLYSSSSHHTGVTATRPLFRALYDDNAEVVLNGHNHHYERYAPMDPFGVLAPTRGIRQFTVGTGGASHVAFGTIHPNSQVRNSTAYGVLKLTLHSNSYDWQFIPVAGQTFTDSGTTTCH